MLAGLLAQFPSGQCKPLKESLPGDDFKALVATLESVTWTLSFNGAAGGGTSQAGIVFHSNNGQREYLATSYPSSDSTTKQNMKL